MSVAAQAPHVHFLAILDTSSDFRCHELRSATSRLPKLLLVAQEVAKAKVCQLDLTILVSEDILRFNIAMQHILLMHGVQRQ